MKDVQPLDLCAECYTRKTGKPFRARRFIMEMYTCKGCGREELVIVYAKKDIWLECAVNRLLSPILRRRYR